MKCPRCNEELRTVTVAGVAVDVCDKCEGVWFDQGELQSLLEKAEDLKASELNRSWEGELRKEAPTGGTINCPKCGREMDRYRYCYSSEIFVDGCGQGCGLWLDDTELRQIVSYLIESNKPLDPETEQKLATSLEAVKADFNQREEALIDSLVKMDDKPGIFQPAGEVLQFVYRILYKMGL